MKQFIVSVVVLFTFCYAGCSKKSDPVPTDTAPTNLTLVANVSTDNSGNVSFTASATNAVTYDFDYGNGIFQTVSSGVVTYKYPAAGNYTVNVIAKSTGGKTASKSTTITVALTSSLVWADEFNTPGSPDPAKWGFDIGAGGWGNAELQHYTSRAENAIVSGGTLKIIAKKESFSGSEYTSARLLSKGKFAFKYGKVEVRAKLPSGVGTWPAAWMLGNNISTAGWPACGEIDIMEHKGSDVNKIYGTLHYPGRSGGNANGATKVIPNVTTQFHKYGVEWTAAAIKISVDDVVFFTFANTTTVPFNQDFFMLLNVAMGGTFGGPVSTGFTDATMEIDYVRVYN